MNDTSWLLALTGALNIGGVIGIIANKSLSSKKEKSESESVAVSTAEKVIQIVREDLMTKVEENAQLKASYNEVMRRVEKLEERERHGLVRAAVHEAWDQMAFTKLSALDGTFPAPPPLTVIGELKDREMHGHWQVDNQTGDSGLPEDGE